MLLARGDADKGASEPVAPAQILGRLVAVERNGRCIDLAGRKAKVKHSIRIHASQCKQQILSYSSPGAQIGVPSLVRSVETRLASVYEQRGECSLSEW